MTGLDRAMLTIGVATWWLSVIGALAWATLVAMTGVSE